MRLRQPAIRRIALTLAAFAFAGTLALPANLRADSLFDTPPAMPMPDHSASRAAREELARARAMLTRARLVARQTQNAVLGEMRDLIGYRSLQSAALRASSDYQSIRRIPLATLSRVPEYAQLSMEREAARQEMRKAVRNGKPDFEKILPLARKALAVGEQMTRDESIVLALDPAVEDARAAMIDAFTMLRRTTKAIDERVANHPETVFARESVEEARARVIQANQNLAAALKAEQAADRERRRMRNG